MRSPFTPLAAALFAASAGGAAPARDAKDAGVIHALPGGAADADGAKGFVADDKGGVTALDLESGKVLWESKTSGQPVAVVGDQVWVQARDKDKGNVVRLIGLKLDDGKAATQSDPIPLPEWVDATPGVGAGRSFASSAALDGIHLLLRWKANAWYWGGAEPPPQVLKAAEKHADGVARVNLETNVVEMLETAKAPSLGPQVSTRLRNAAAANYGDDQLTVATAGDYAVAVSLEAVGVKQKVVLKRWELATEKPLAPLVLTEGAAYQIFTLPSAGVVLVREASAGGPPGAGDWTWTVYDLATGKEAAHFNADSHGEDFTVIGPRAYYVLKETPKGPRFGGVLPRKLIAVDLTTDKRLWEKPLEGERLPPPPPP